MVKNLYIKLSSWALVFSSGGQRSNMTSRLDLVEHWLWWRCGEELERPLTYRWASTQAHLPTYSSVAFSPSPSQLVTKVCWFPLIHLALSDSADMTFVQILLSSHQY
jgi:hypothetical protein